jgi:hypothetical protein
MFVMLIPQAPVHHGVPPAAAQASPTLVQTARNQSVALAATNPLGDPAAAALIAANAAESSENPSSAQ